MSHCLAQDLRDLWHWTHRSGGPDQRRGADPGKSDQRVDACSKRGGPSQETQKVCAGTVQRPRRMMPVAFAPAGSMCVSGRRGGGGRALVCGVWAADGKFRGGQQRITPARCVMPRVGYATAPPRPPFLVRSQAKWWKSAV